MVVFILRHADRTPDPDDDLTPAGLQRAQLLARMLAESRISIAFRSQWVRARRTLEPLKQKLGNALTIKEVLNDDPGGPDQHVHDIVQAVKALPASIVAAVVSHSDTVGRIVQDLGGDPVGLLGKHEFDKLFVL